MSRATTHPYGLLAVFDSAEALLSAAKKAHAAGYRQMDAYSPVPVEGLAEALGRKKTRMPLVFLLGGIAGGTSAYFMQWYSMAVDYPYNIGGRPFHSWPMFIPVTFELTVLLAAISGVCAMLFFNGLPRLHHPIFQAPGIERASLDRFFLCLESADPMWHAENTLQFIRRELDAGEISEVPG
jgi:hypothetical protein